jgi:glycosyltransferase involved in cell wall biosynthesis
MVVDPTDQAGICHRSTRAESRMTPTFPSQRTGICIIGRTDFQSGMGSLTFAACELLSRYFEVSLLPSRDEPRSFPSYATLPTGRMVPLVRSAEGFAATLYLDVLWNGAYDRGYELVPNSGFRVIQIAYDSDELPPEWTEILNKRFDLALFSTAHLETVARNSGVTIPTGTLPIALDLESLVSRRYRAPIARKLRFGTLSAFHDRKGLDVLVEAFLDLYAGRSDVELVIHSNLAIGDVYERVMHMRDAAGAANVIITHGSLAASEKNALLETFDVYVNCSRGEGYSIGPREALALGKPIIVTDLGAHADFAGVPGVFHFAPAGRMPARYPEIDNRVFGSQTYLDVPAVTAGLAAAREFALSEYAPKTAAERRRLAAQFSFSDMAAEYRRLFDPESAKLRPGFRAEESFTRLDGEAARLATKATGRHGTNISQRGKLVIRAHDGGFFSIFNAFMSHLAWGLRDPHFSMVIPDWNVTRIMQEDPSKPISSYCYSRPEDGNLWLKLFEPLYDLTPGEMNDADFLASNSEYPFYNFNENREPLLTFTHAYELYRAPWFSRFRTQYGRVLREYVRLRPELQSELDGAMRDYQDGRFLISVHVKHPSHGVEQPGQKMAHRNEYVDAVRKNLARRGISEQSGDWAVFVATDQERVVSLFKQEFGGHVMQFDDVSRIDPAVDNVYDALTPDQKLQEGHQLQHQMAANVDLWSWRLAWEVWRDAEVMAASNVLIHAVSNVATAVSYMGPHTEMIYLDPQ